VKWERCGACDFCLGVESVPAAAAAPTRPAKRHNRNSGQLAFAPRAGQLPDQALLEALKNWRRERARQDQVPAFFILHDSVLSAICLAKPGSAAELSSVGGIGENKLARFGEPILRIVRDHAGKRASGI
jgi:ATP-dependent DNA helicase RecQ